jgi:hypothetical protein
VESESKVHWPLTIFIRSTQGLTWSQQTNLKTRNILYHCVMHCSGGDDNVISCALLLLFYDFYTIFMYNAYVYVYIICMSTRECVFDVFLYRRGTFCTYVCYICIYMLYMLCMYIYMLYCIRFTYRVVVSECILLRT